MTETVHEGLVGHGKDLGFILLTAIIPEPGLDTQLIFAKQMN